MYMIITMTDQAAALPAAQTVIVCANAGPTYELVYRWEVLERWNRNETFRLQYSSISGFASTPTNRYGIPIPSHQIGNNMVHIPHMPFPDANLHSITVLYDNTHVPVGAIITGAKDACLTSIKRV